jgi:hypothetical protein
MLQRAPMPIWMHQNLPTEFLWTAIRGCVESEKGSRSWSLMKLDFSDSGIQVLKCLELMGWLCLVGLVIASRFPLSAP